MTSKELLGEFLDEVWGTGPKPRKVFVAYKPNPNSFDVPPGQLWPQSRERILDFIQGMNAKAKTPYYNPAMFEPDAISNEKQYVMASWVLWCDFDGNAKDALTILRATPSLPRPTWRLQSGLEGHEHWYWILKAPAGAQRFEEINRKLAYYLDADIGCWNANRVMRPPYTTNYMDAKKYDGKGYSPQPVDFISRTGERYDIQQFDFLPDVKDSIEKSVSNLGDIPSIADVLAKYKWDSKHLDLFKNPPMDQGKRSDGIVRLAYFGAEVGMTDEAIYAVISDVDNRVGKFRDRADRERRLAEIIAKVRAKHPYVENVTVTQTKESLQLVYTANELLRSDFQIEWLIQDLIVARTTNFISAESGIGKSRLAMQLAKAMATGTQFLKWPCERQISVMYLSLEMPGDMLKHFLTGLLIGKEMNEDESDKFMLVPLGKAIDLAKPEGYEFLEMLIKEHKPEVMMIDAMGKLTFEEMGETQAKAINNQLNKLTQDYGTTFFIIHHNRKPDLTGKKRPGLGDVYGNQYVVTDASTVFTMFMPENQTHVELIFAKSRAYPADDFVVMNGKKGFSFTIKENVEHDDDAGQDEAGIGFKR
jgi:AAA domain-containing protein